MFGNAMPIRSFDKKATLELRSKSMAQQFDELGFLVVRSLLSPEEANDYRAALLKRAGLQEGRIDPKVRWCQPDGPNKYREWWPLIVHERLVSLLREAIGPDIRYLQNADLQINNSRSIWHRDSPSRQFGIGPDFDESCAKYQVYRVGVSLQSYKESGSALGLIPGSHRRESAFTRFEFRFWDRVRRVLSKQYILPPFLSVRPVWVKTEPGDVVIFDARVLHAPSYFYGPKLAVYLSYGANNQHSHNFRKHYVHDRESLQYDDLDPELKQLLAQRGMLMEDEAVVPVRAGSEH